MVHGRMDLPAHVTVRMFMKGDQETMENMKELQQKLADRQATDVILALPAEVIDTVVWRNTTGHDVAWECKYLHLRGLLRRNADKPHLVVLRSVS